MVARFRLHVTSVLLLLGVCGVGEAAVAPAEAPASAREPGPRVDRPQRVLAARRFPGWQAWNVGAPFVIAERDGGRDGLRMYYAGTSTSRINASVWEDWVIGLVFSQDGLTWRFPEVYEPVLLARPSLEGDVLDPEDLAAVFDSVAVTDPCVVADGAAWRMWYAGWNGESEPSGDGLERSIHQRIGLAVSSDGRRWEKQRGGAGGGAVLGLGTAGEPDALAASDPHVLAVTDGWRMWYEGYDGRTWRILSATSRDGLAWTKEGVALEPGESGEADVLGARHPVVLRRGAGSYELWYQALGEGRRPLRVRRATSNNGHRWTKLPGDVDLWSRGMADADPILGSILVNEDGSYRVYFANRRTSPVPLPKRGWLAGYEVFVTTVRP